MTLAKSDLPLAPTPYHRLYFSISLSWRDTVFTVASLRASSVLNLEALPRPCVNLHAFRAPTRPPGRSGA